MEASWNRGRTPAPGNILSPSVQSTLRGFSALPPPVNWDFMRPCEVLLEMERDHDFYVAWVTINDIQMR